MTEETELEKPEDEVLDPEAEPEVTEDEGKQPDEYEARALRMGWVPQDRFRGDSARWVDAKTFVERGENELPILRERLRKADEHLREFGELKETVKEFRGYMTDVEQRAYNRAKRDLELQRQAAKEAGDFDRYDQVTTEIGELEANAKPKQDKTQEKTEVKPDPMKDPVFTGWVDDNDWFQKDPERAAYANSYGEYLNRTKPHLHGQAFLEEVTKAVKKEFPDKFENPRRNGVPRVEAGGVGKAKGNGKTYNDLPADAKAACDRFVKQGLVKKEDYVKDYFTE